MREMMCGDRPFVRVDVHDAYLRERPPMELLNFRAWLDAKMDEIPEEYRGSAEIDLLADSEGFSVFGIYYLRPMNDDEFAEHQAQERAKQQRIDANERAQYERLKIRFEGNRGGP